MNDDGLKLTTYFGERDRAGGRFLADAISDIYARAELEISLLLRGVAGFGVRHHLHSDRLLTLSEDLPLVSVAADARGRIQSVLGELERLRFDGLVTIERARLLTGSVEATAITRERRAGDAAKLTVYVGRGVRLGGQPAYEAVVAGLHDHGVAGATVLLGVDGTVHGVRQRARFFGRNTTVPMMVIAVGAHESIAAAASDLGAILPRPLMTLERVRVCKRDGIKLAEPHELPDADRSGLGIWQKLMIYAGEQSHHAGHPLAPQLTRALREAGAAGATSLRGVWGYHGDHRPHGDSLWQLRRRVPVVTVVVDTPRRSRGWFGVIDELTDETGLVTSEVVPAFRATGPALRHGGLELAQRWF